MAIDYSRPGFYAGASQGKERAQEAEFKSMYDLMALNDEKTSMDVEKIQKNFDTLATAISTVSEIGGGYVSNRKMKYQTLPGVQEWLAEKDYSASSFEIVEDPVTGSSMEVPKLDWDKLQPGAKQKIIGKYKPIEVGRSLAEKFFGAEKQYKFGEHTLSEAEITQADLGRKFGMDMDMDLEQFSSKYEMPSIWEDFQGWFNNE